MRLFVVTVLLVSTFQGFCQLDASQYRDSLEEVLGNIRNLEKEQGKNDDVTQKVALLCLLSRKYDGIDSTKTFEYALEALRISEETEFEKGLADANFTLGRAFMYIDPKEALIFLSKGKALADQLVKKDSTRDHWKLWANCTYNLGLTNGYMGAHQKELDMTDVVIPIVKKLGDTIFLANIYTNLGVKHLNLVEFDKAYYNLQIGRQLYRALDDPQQTTFNLLQLAMTYDGLDSLNIMKKTLDEAALLIKKYPDPFDLFNYGLQNSQYFKRIGKPQNAVMALDSIRYLVANNQQSLNYGMVMQRYAMAYAAMDDYDNATTYMTQYIENATTIKNEMNRFQGFYKRSQFFAEIRDYENAYQDLLMAIDIYDSLETGNTVAKLEELNLKYDTAEREKAILSLQVKNEEKKSQAYLLGVIACILSLSLFGGYYAYDRKLRRVRKKERIREAEMNLLKQEQQNKVFSAMIDGQEKERKRLAIDLHDGLGGRLSGISLNLSKLDKDQPTEYPKKQLQKVMKDLNDSLSELRSIARNMMPETLVKFGLQAALKDYCSSMTGKDTKVTLQFYGTEKGIDLQQQVTMYRVIQELINNAIKHANASEVLVQYMREGNHVDITVEDNGIGMLGKLKDQESSGMGLNNLKTRVAYLNGELDFQSEANEGTTVNVHITIDAA